MALTRAKMRAFDSNHRSSFHDNLTMVRFATMPVEIRF